MSRKHHKSNYKSKKAKTIPAGSSIPSSSSVTTQEFTVKKEEPKTYTTTTKSYNKPKYTYKPCHNITEIYENFFLMKGSDEHKFVTEYKPDVLVPLAGTTTNIYDNGFRGDIYYFPCPDYGTLPNEILDKLVLKIVAGLTYGLKIGMYCIGGHGRTGYVAACVLGVLGIADPIQYLWTKYCEKAIESRSQLFAIAEYLNKPELYDKYKRKIHDFTWEIGTSLSSYGWGSDWGYTGTVPTTHKSSKTYSPYSWDLDDDDDGYGSIVENHFNMDTYIDELIAKAAQEDSEYDDIPIEELDDLDENLAWRKAQEGRVLTPSEIKMLQDDPMWACSESTLGRLQGDELMEAFEYLKDVYGIV